MEVRTQPMVRRRETENAPNDACCGYLPANAPLANPYVPFQCNNPPTYPAKTGVVRGTLFPGLDLPFMGMVNTEPLPDTHLNELQTLGFALVELGEYLDTLSHIRQHLTQNPMEAFLLLRCICCRHRLHCRRRPRRRLKL